MKLYSRSSSGAEEADTLMVFSCNSCTTMADVASAAPNLHRWQQIYPFNDRQLTLHFIHEAERLGFSALVVTVDSPVPGFRSDETMDNNPAFR